MRKTWLSDVVGTEKAAFGLVHLLALPQRQDITSGRHQAILLPRLLEQDFTLFGVLTEPITVLISEQLMAQTFLRPTAVLLLRLHMIHHMATISPSVMAADV